MSADLGDAPTEAKKLALMIGSAAADAMLFLADLGEEFPLLQPVLKALKGIREKVETARSNPEELAALHERCTFITACFIVKCRHNSSDLDVVPLEKCVKEVGNVVERCSRRSTVSRILKASSDKGEILRLQKRLGDLEGDLSLAGIATLVSSSLGRVASPCGLPKRYSVQSLVCCRLRRHSLLHKRRGWGLQLARLVP